MMERRPLTTGSMSTNGSPPTKMTNRLYVNLFLQTKMENLSGKLWMVCHLILHGTG